MCLLEWNILCCAGAVFTLSGVAEQLSMLQNWEFDERGYMRKRDACINNVPIEDSVRRLEGWEIHDKA